MNKIQKTILIFFLSLLIIAGATLLIAPFLLQGPLKTALEDEFTKQTNKEYTFDFSTLDIGIFSRTISIDSVLIEPDTSTAKFRKITATSVFVNGIKWRTLLSKSFPDFANIVIKEPQIEFFTQKLSSSFFANDSANQGADLENNFNNFNVIIENGSGKLVHRNKTEVLVVDSFSMEAVNVNLNVLFGASDLFFIENLTLHGTRLQWLMEKQLYRFTIENFSFDKQSESLALFDLTLTPVLPKYEFSRIHAEQINRYDLSIPEIEFSGFNLDSLSKNHLEIDSLKIHNARMDVFRDKQKKRAPGITTKPMLNEIAHAINFSFGLNTFIVSDTDISYELHNPPADTTGTVSFNNINAVITKFRSATHPDFQKDTLKLRAETLLMDSAPLSVTIHYPVFNKNDLHTVKATLGSMNPKIVGNILENTAFVRIEDGYIESLESEIVLNSETSMGEVLVLYHDLKVSFLNEEHPERKNLRLRAGNFLTNTFVIKSDNLRGNPRIGKINFERNKEKAILAFWVGSVLDGIQKSIR